MSGSTMKMQRFTTMKMSFHTNSQGLSKVKPSSEELMSNILNRKWRLHLPDTNIHQIRLSPVGGENKNGPLSNMNFINNSHPCLGDQLMEKDSQNPSFYVVRDDLLHPLVNGNKARKLDGLLPLLMDHLVTDVVTCGGCQSAHGAAVAVSCAEIGIKSHLLLRGEQPEVLTGYNLISTLYGNVTYVPRHLYAQRETMLKTHANLVAGNAGEVLCCNDILETFSTSETSGASNMGKMNSCTSIEDYPRKVLIINEGAGDVVALLGAIRLVKYLCQSHLLGRERRVRLVVDAGTGTTAIGLGLGALCLGVPWEVTAVMLVETIDAFQQREKCLISDFRTKFGDHCLTNIDNGVVHWVERNRKRKFGNVLEGEIEACQQIARQTGILADPVYTLAAWELAVQLSNDKEDDAQVVMLHTGGTLGMFGLAQRYKSYFHGLKH
ncbi:D-cysteine desulfhydrase 2, mitochondrial-like isoform X2 [Mercurialis annua]|nr:D-cysteine desulfhydrase 2, mitochondrial-like isoform X2 [Mercurialis annua]XP_055959584.1 D-cysteine desulfhydrase 2, mitochondrial-like isoform X2 [Mercurialis annua]